jgi:hypothetical protein
MNQSRLHEENVAFQKSGAINRALDAKSESRSKFRFSALEKCLYRDEVGLEVVKITPELIPPQSIKYFSLRLNARPN